MCSPRHSTLLFILVFFYASLLFTTAFTKNATVVHNINGQTSTTDDPQAAIISSGGFSTCVITTQGVVKCWGGIIGSSIPVDIEKLNGRATSIGVGSDHVCVVVDSGIVQCWGANYTMQLGDGTRIDQSIPVTVTGLNASMTFVTSGGNHSCAISREGGAKCWGGNFIGQLGNGTMENPMEPSGSPPSDVLGLTNGVISIAAGLQHTCALTISGKVKCWGALYQSENQILAQTQPMDVTGFSTKIIQISAGANHTCAIDENGDVWCWGYNGNGQLGDGSRITYSTPVKVINLGGKAHNISLSGEHSCAGLENGEVKCWGRNASGELGDGTLSSREAPVKVKSLTVPITQIASGSEHTCAASLYGHVLCWGRTTEGQLGIGVDGNSDGIRVISGLHSGVNQITAGEFHTCANYGTGVQCWGDNGYGQLGGEVDPSHGPLVEVTGLITPVISISTGYAHNCSVASSSQVQCWGWNSVGQLGDGTRENKNYPVKVIGLTGKVKTISVSDGHSCLLTAFGRVKCWGQNEYGQLGNGTTDQQSHPVNVVGLSQSITKISDGACVLLENGAVNCWGFNAYGFPGNGGSILSTVPVTPTNMESGVLDIASQGSTVCALIDSGAVKCWGGNYYGQLGDGTMQDRTEVVNVIGLSGPVDTIYTSGTHTCALLKDKTVDCWGKNDQGQLGVGNSLTQTVPLHIPNLDNVKSLALGGSHTCALLETGTVKCWGSNLLLQLSGLLLRATPQEVPGFKPIYVSYLPMIKR